MRNEKRRCWRQTREVEVEEEEKIISLSLFYEKFEFEWRVLLDATNSAPSCILRKDCRHLLCGENTFLLLKEAQKGDQNGESAGRR